jgi:hypothetical protein
MEMTAKDVRDILSDMEKRVAEIRAIGGVALMDVVDGKTAIPSGWVLDLATNFYVPPWWMWEPDRKPS